MANKRELKKNIRLICGDIAGECIFSEFALNADSQKISQVIINLADLQEESVQKVSFSYDKVEKDFETRKDYKKAKNRYFKNAYTALKKEFNDGIKEIVKELNETMPSSK